MHASVCIALENSLPCTNIFRQVSFLTVQIKCSKCELRSWKSKLGQAPFTRLRFLAQKVALWHTLANPVKWATSHRHCTRYDADKVFCSQICKKILTHSYPDEDLQPTVSVFKCQLAILLSDLQGVTILVCQWFYGQETLAMFTLHKILDYRTYFIIFWGTRFRQNHRIPKAGLSYACKWFKHTSRWSKLEEEAGGLKFVQAFVTLEISAEKETRWVVELPLISSTEGLPAFLDFLLW